MRFQDKRGHLYIAVVLVVASWLSFGLATGFGLLGWFVSGALWSAGGGLAVVLGRRVGTLIADRSAGTPHAVKQSIIGVGGAVGGGVLGPALAPLLGPQVALPTAAWIILLAVGMYGPVAVRADEVLAAREDKGA